MGGQNSRLLRGYISALTALDQAFIHLRPNSSVGPVSEAKILNDTFIITITFIMEVLYWRPIVRSYKGLFSLGVDF